MDLKTAYLILLALSLPLWTACTTEDPGDMEPPVLIVTKPADGITVAPESKVRMEFTITDNEALALWVINVKNESNGTSAYAASDSISGTTASVVREFTTSITSPTEYEIVISAIDAAHNEAIETIHITSQ